MIIARQRFGKHIFEVMKSTVERPTFLGDKSVGTFRNNGQNTDNNRRTVRGSALSSVLHEL
jgi:hypothetical protein